MPRRGSKVVVLDTWAVIAYFEDEPAGRQVADIIADAHERGLPLLMSVANVGEIWYLFARKLSEAEADQTISELAQLGMVSWMSTGPWLVRPPGSNRDTACPMLTVLLLRLPSKRRQHW